MFRAIVLIVSLIFCATTAYAEEKLEKVQDCKYWNTRMVMSKTSGAVGHVISGKLEGQSCQYDVRFALKDGGLLMVVGLRDYELEWAPSFTDGGRGERKPEPQKAPEDYTGDLDFGE